MGFIEVHDTFGQLAQGLRIGLAPGRRDAAPNTDAAQQKRPGFPERSGHVE